jgi:hypothetical protein
MPDYDPEWGCMEINFQLDGKLPFLYILNSQPPFLIIVI